MSASGRLTGAQVETRLREASSLSDLGDGMRLYGKIGMGPEAIAARLRDASRLRELCLRLEELGRGQGLATPDPDRTPR